MPARILKAAFTSTGTYDLSMPQGAKIVHVHEQDGAVAVWYLCDPSLPAVSRTIEIVGTGWQLGAPLRYLGTAHVGSYVWHVLERVA